MVLSIALLGAVSVSVGGRPIRLNGRLGRTTLAALALRTGPVVSPEQLIDAKPNGWYRS